MTISWNLPMNIMTGGYFIPQFPVFPNWYSFPVPNYNYNYNFMNFSFPTLTKPAVSTFKFDTSKANNDWKNIKTDNFELTNDFGKNMVLTAKKYKGINEMDGSAAKFGGNKFIPWCALFVTYVARENGSDIPRFAKVDDIYKWGNKNNKFHKTPRKGDAIILRGANSCGKDAKGKNISHTGIVDRVEDGIVYVIAGNSGSHNKGKVKYETYRIDDTKITGYVSLS